MKNLFLFHTILLFSMGLLFCSFSHQSSPILMTAEVNLQVLLEGSNNGDGTMYNKLVSAWDNPLIPFTQPYDIAPWNYLGTETITNLPSDVVDWVFITLRTDISDPATNIASFVALVTKSGQVIDVDGNTTVEFPLSTADPAFIIIEHRNHLPLRSGQIITPNAANVYEHNFTTDTGTTEHKNINGLFWMFAGNSEQATSVGDRVDINATDYSTTSFNFSNAITNQTQFPTYDTADFDMNGDLNIKDLFLTYNLGVFSSINF